MACSKPDNEGTVKTSSEHLLVAAIDFGTTYTGFAYSFKSDPTAIMTSRWVGDNIRSATEKAPTCVLLSPDKKFLAFGYDAEDMFKELLEDTDSDLDAKECYYFERFKMKLYQTKNLKMDTELSDVNGKKLLALNVFAVVISHLKEKVYDQMNRVFSGFNAESDVCWVITVPAIWSDSAKQFMRTAADKAGLKNENVRLILEPEAASLFCNDENICKIAKFDGSTALEKFPIGMKYIVADLGGGTADLSVHEILIDRNLREIHRANGDALGGMMVDLEFMKFLEEIFGSDAIKLLSERYKKEVMDVQLMFETKKRTFDYNKYSEIKIKVPLNELNEVLEELQEGDVEGKIKQASERDGLKSLKLKCRTLLCFDNGVMEKFFSEAIDGIIEHINKMRENDEVGEINHLLMVGGFSESGYVQHIIEQRVPGVIIVVPPEPSLSVLKGAVIAGHNPKSITERIARYTYGFSFARPFKQGEDREELKIIEDEKEYCTHVFDKMITKGDILKVGDHFGTPCFHTIDNSSLFGILMRSMPIWADVYRSEDKDPKYTDKGHGCELVGLIMIQAPPGGWPPISVLVQELVVGEAEFTVRAINLNTMSEYEGQLDFLQSIRRE